MARLVVISRNAAASIHELDEGWAAPGRADGNTFQIGEPSISGRHCEVRTRGQELLVRDLLSATGTQGGNQTQRVGDNLVTAPADGEKPSVKN